VRSNSRVNLTRSAPESNIRASDTFPARSASCAAAARMWTACQSLVRFAFPFACARCDVALANSIRRAVAFCNIYIDATRRNKTATLMKFARRREVALQRGYERRGAALGFREGIKNLLPRADASGPRRPRCPHRTGIRPRSQKSLLPGPHP